MTRATPAELPAPATGSFPPPAAPTTSAPLAPRTTVPGSATPPAYFTIKCATRAVAASAISPSTPPSKQPHAPPHPPAPRPVPPRGARDRNGVEVRRLDKHVARAVSQLGVGTSHDTSKPNRTPVVRDNQILRGEGALFLVKRCERVARARAPHGDAAAQRVEVITVNRLPDLKHDVVRDVNEQRAGSDTRERESGHHPRRCRAARGGTAHDASGKHGYPGATTNRIIIGERDREEAGNTRRTVGDGISRTGLPNTPTTQPHDIGHPHRITKRPPPPPPPPPPTAPPPPKHGGPPRVRHHPAAPPRGSRGRSHDRG